MWIQSCLSFDIEHSVQKSVYSQILLACFESSVSLIFFKAKFRFIKLPIAHCLGFYRLHWQTLLSSNQPIWSFLNSGFKSQTNSDFACAIWRHQLFQTSSANHQRISQVCEGNSIITQLDSVFCATWVLAFKKKIWAGKLILWMVEIFGNLQIFRNSHYSLLQIDLGYVYLFWIDRLFDWWILN